MYLVGRRSAGKVDRPLFLVFLSRPFLRRTRTVRETELDYTGRSLHNLERNGQTDNP